MPGNMQFINTVDEFFDEDYDTGEFSITAEQYAPSAPSYSWVEYGEAVVKKDRSARRLAALTASPPAEVKTEAMCVNCDARRWFGIWCNKHVPDGLRCIGITSMGQQCKHRPQANNLRCGNHVGQTFKVTLDYEPVATPAAPKWDEALDTFKEDYSMQDFFIVAGTGSRQLQNAPTEHKLKLLEWLEVSLTKTRAKHPNLMVMSGMAEGFDKALALTALKLDIPLWCAIPSPDYGAYYWGRKSLTGRDMLHQFEDIISKATKVTYTMKDPKGSKKYGFKYGSANFDRNDFMVATADAFLIYDPSTAGTSHAFAAIRETGKPFIIIKQ